MLIGYMQVTINSVFMYRSTFQISWLYKLIMLAATHVIAIWTSPFVVAVLINFSHVIISRPIVS